MKELKRGSTHSTHPMVSRVNLPMHLPSVHECVKHKYRDAIVVFDGYDCTHT